MRKQAEKKLREKESYLSYLAHHDILTNLPNRLLFTDRLNIAMAQAQHNKQLITIMSLDLDRFKHINDTLGHPTGDMLLQTVAERLLKCLRKGDTIARLGGDEFILLLPQFNRTEDAARLAQKILDTMEPVFRINGHEFYISTSIGIAVYPADGEDMRTLLRNVDLALYRAKEQGKNNYQFYTSAMNVKAMERLNMENSMHKALERDEFLVYYQPKLNIDSGQIIGLEALLRWQHPELGLVEPSEFLFIAEETGMIQPIGEWVLRRACEQNKIWQLAGYTPLVMGVNISARQLRKQGLERNVAKVLTETGLDSRFLELEIAEDIAMDYVEDTVAILRRLHDLGIQISIDDFGVGYTSLSYVKKFPIHTLKIDRSLVRNIATNSDDAAIATAVIDLAHRMKLKVIAEGVETKELLEFLRSLKCDEMQGFLFSRPLPADEITKILKNRIGF